jgi:hypothetical protein
LNKTPKRPKKFPVSRKRRNRAISPEALANDFARSVSDRLDKEAKSASTDCNTHETTEQMPNHETFMGASDNPPSSSNEDSQRNTRLQAVKKILEGIKK